MHIRRGWREGRRGGGGGKEKRPWTVKRAVLLLSFQHPVPNHDDYPNPEKVRSSMECLRLILVLVSHTTASRLPTSRNADGNREWNADDLIASLMTVRGGSRIPWSPWLSHTPEPASRCCQSLHPHISMKLPAPRPKSACWWSCPSSVGRCAPALKKKTQNY